MTDFSKQFFGVEEITLSDKHTVVKFAIRPAGSHLVRRFTTDFEWGHAIDPEISEAAGILSRVLKQKALDTFADLELDPDPTPVPVANVDGVQ